MGNLSDRRSGRHGRRRFLGKGRGEKGKDEYGVEVEKLVGSGVGRGIGVGVKGGFLGKGSEG